MVAVSAKSVLVISVLLLCAQQVVCLEDGQTCSEDTCTAHSEELSQFLGLPKFHVSGRVFQQDRFPNVVVTMKGTVLLVWGARSVHARRSEDAGETWGDEIIIARSGIHSGGAIVDEVSGEVLVFVEDKHPPAPVRVYRSRDDGRSWDIDAATFLPDSTGRLPSMHMNEHGITLQYGAHAGRLLRCSRWYGEGDEEADFQGHFANAVYSDDRGKTWHTSEPFPAMGTGEAAVAELNTGVVHYNSRRHWMPEGVAETRRRWGANSSDGGVSWEGLVVIDELPDGPQGGEVGGFGLFGGLVRLPVSGRNILVYSSCDSEEWRENGAVWASFDGGQSWPHKRRFFDVEGRLFAYSSLSAGRTGTASQGWIYCFFESTDFGPRDGYVARFNIAWLLASP